MSFAEQLKIYREQKNLSLKEMANLLKVKYTTYLSWENGKEPKYNVLIQLANFFNVTVDELLDSKLEPAFFNKKDSTEFLEIKEVKQKNISEFNSKLIENIHNLCQKEGTTLENLKDYFKYNYVDFEKVITDSRHTGLKCLFEISKYFKIPLSDFFPKFSTLEPVLGIQHYPTILGSYKSAYKEAVFIILEANYSIKISDKQKNNIISNAPNNTFSQNFLSLGIIDKNSPSVNYIVSQIMTYLGVRKPSKSYTTIVDSNDKSTSVSDNDFVEWYLAIDKETNKIIKAFYISAFNLFINQKT